MIYISSKIQNAIDFKMVKNRAKTNQMVKIKTLVLL